MRGLKRIMQKQADAAIRSHLLQMRGLKLNPVVFGYGVKWSHLLQMRGLKRPFFLYEKQSFESHLLQMRGLKLEAFVTLDGSSCRIFYRCVD